MHPPRRSTQILTAALTLAGLLALPWQPLSSAADGATGESLVGGLLRQGLGKLNPTAQGNVSEPDVPTRPSAAEPPPMKGPVLSPLGPFLAEPGKATLPRETATVCKAGPPSCDYAVIQDAVDAAAGGDTIKVATGVYSDIHSLPPPPWYPRRPPSGVITQVVYISKSITIRGGYTTSNGFAEPPDPMANPTTLDAAGQGRVLLVVGQITVTVEGLRLTGGDGLGLGGQFGPGWYAGAGVYIVSATAALSNNWVFDNVVPGWPYPAGGGLYMAYGHAVLSGNTFTGNEAWGCWMFGCDGAGGGLYLFQSRATIGGNTLVSNTAQGGGGIGLAGGDVSIVENTISGNSGGGLDLGWGSHATLIANTIISNSAGSGGGLSLSGSTAVLSGNTVVGNAAMVLPPPFQGLGLGGGLYLYGSEATLSDNVVADNEAYRGGGLYIGGSEATLSNNVVADNQAGRGSGLYVTASSPHLLHNTIARNGSNGIYVTGSTINLTNTILVSHVVGITVSAGSTAKLEATLWGSDPWANITDTTGDGTILTGTVNLWEEPDFVDPDTGDYHIGPGSGAIDAGVDAGVASDIDGEPRPCGASTDIGADELWPTLSVLKQAIPDPLSMGEELSYTLWVTNTGLMTLTATMSDVLPPQVTPTGTLTWTAQIIPGDVWTETVVVTVELGYIGPLTNVVRVASVEGATAVYTHIVAVEEPIAGLEATNDGPTPLGSPTTLSATIAAGSNVTFEWDLGDGTLGIGPVLAHTYPAALTYTAVVTATNGVSAMIATTVVMVVGRTYLIYLPLVVKNE